MNILSYTAAFPNFNRLHENVIKYYADNLKLPNLTYEEENDLVAVKKIQNQMASFIVFKLFRNKKYFAEFLQESLTKATHEKFSADEVVKFSAKFERHPDGNANF